MSNKIKIYGDIESASMFFVGSTVTPKPMGVVVATAHPTLTDRIVVKRNDRFKRDKVSFRVLFRQLNINRICNRDEQELVGTLGYTREQILEYINTQANLQSGTSGGDGSGTDMTGLDVCFKLDATSTSVMIDTGHEFGVNTIKATENNGVIDIVSELGTLVHFTNLEVGRICGHDGAIVGGGINDVINYLNELFTVGAFESVVIADPYSTMIADVNGVDNGYTLEGADAIDPIGDDIFTYDGVGYANYAGLKSNAIIDQKGEYFTFDIRGEGTIGFGLIHTDDSFNNGLYSGNANYADPSNFAAVNSAHYGFQFSHWFHATPNGSWTNYGANTSYSMRAGWSNFNGTDEQADWLAGNPIKIKVGIDENGYIAISTLRNGTDWEVHARSGYPLPQGSSYHLGIKSQSTSARVYSAPKVHLLEPEAPTMYFRYIESPDSNFQFPLFATQEEADYYELETSGVDNGSHTHLFVDDPTNTIWYMPNSAHEMNGGSIPTGTFKGQAINYTEITSLSDSDLAPSSFIIPQQYMIEGGTINYQLSPQDVSYTTSISGQPSWLSLSGGYLLTGTANYVSEDTDYTITVTRTNSYGSTSTTFVVTVQDDIVSSQLSGITTAYGNTLNPNHVFNTEGFAGKLNTVISQGQEISWTHRDYTVGGFLTSGAISNFNNGVDIENASNWDLRFSNWTSELMKTFSKGWAVGGSQNVGNLDGATHKMVYKTDGYVEYYLNDVLKYTSADAYTGDKDLYLMTPNSYNINIELPIDFTVVTTGAGATVPPSGFNSPLEQGEMGGADILGNGSDAVATSVFTVNSGNRLIITQEWIEANVLPYMDSDEDKVFLGIPKTTANYSSVTLDDFDMVIRLQKSGNGVKSLIYDNGSNQNEVTVSSLSDAFYNYAFEWDGTNLALIAHSTYGDFSTIHSVADGGSFNRSIIHSNFTQQSGNLPFVIATNDDGQVKLNPNFVGMSIPATPSSNLTNWTKALDFSGSNEHLKQVGSNNYVQPIRLGGYGTQVSNNTDSNKTVDSGFCFAWATSIVFKTDRNNSNQHIWNMGEGAGSSDDNIYLRTDSAGNLYFGWGRGSDNNECKFTTNLNSAHYYGVYVAFKGGRFNSSNATAANLADAFDIRMMTSEYGFPSLTSNLSTVDNWNDGSTGNRTDRTFSGDFTIGGRGSNRNFHGKVASMVVTTLKRNVDIPTTAEIELMITDPVKWVDDYKVGESYRVPQSASENPNGQIGDTGFGQATQVWLMGDGANDSYANGMRNYIEPNDQNNTKLQLNSMVSNDIETVNINGLT